MHVTAVILSYNSINTLINVLNALQNQSLSVNQIILVDNNSNDGTLEHLRKVLDESHVISRERNCGVGAGHNAGWKVALEDYECDLIWALEHDTIPKKDCLEKLIQAYNAHTERKSIGVICPSASEDYTKLGEKGAYLLKGKQGFVRFRKYPYGKEPFFCRSFTFNGTLFPAHVVRKAGLLREDLFLGHEDFEYAARLKKYGFKFLAVPLANISHDILKSCKIVYFAQRAFILPDQSPARAYYGKRNAIYLRKVQGQSGRLLVKIIITSIFSAVFIIFLKDKKFQRLHARLFSIVDGWRGNLGPKRYSFLNLS